MSDFFDQYKHPLWQKKRLEALQAAEFVCNCCMNADEQLHVHHKVYVKGRKVWEYQINELEVLCDGCHKDAHQYRNQLNELLLRLPAEGLRDVIGLISGYCASVNGPASIETSDLPIDAPYQEAIGLIAGTISRLGFSIGQVHEIYGSLEVFGYVPTKAWKVKKRA